MARLRFLAPVLLAAALLVPAVPSSAKIQIGISDNDPTFFLSQYFKPLKMRYARIVVPWNTGLRTDYWKDRMDLFIAQAKADNVQPHVAFGSDLDKGASLHAKGPTPAQYKKAVKAFRRSGGVSLHALERGEPPVPADLQQPEVAARYYDASRSQCKGCPVLGADVLDSNNLTAWLKRYKKEVKKVNHGVMPALWGLHNYQDANHLR